MKNDNCVIVSFYADRDVSRRDRDSCTYYSDHAIRLKKELDMVNINYDIRELQSENNYMKNCLMKPGFILSVIEERKSPILWMDIDSVVNDFPHDFIDNDYDMCVVKRDERVPESCFIYFNYTENSLKFIKEWKQLSENTITNLDHLIMIDLYKKYKDIIKIKEYPWFYATPQNVKEAKILMISSKFLDKRLIEIEINKNGAKWKK